MYKRALRCMCPGARPNVIFFTRGAMMLLLFACATAALPRRTCIHAPPHARAHTHQLMKSAALVSDCCMYARYGQQITPGPPCQSLLYLITDYSWRLPRLPQDHRGDHNHIGTIRTGEWLCGSVPVRLFSEALFWRTRERVPRGVRYNHTNIQK